MKKIERTEVLTDVHSFKKKFLPTSYKQELEQGMTDEERVEWIFRQAVKGTYGTLNKQPNSERVRNLEDLDT